MIIISLYNIRLHTCTQKQSCQQLSYLVKLDTEKKCEHGDCAELNNLLNSTPAQLWRWNYKVKFEEIFILLKSQMLLAFNSCSLLESSRYLEAVSPKNSRQHMKCFQLTSQWQSDRMLSLYSMKFCNLKRTRVPEHITCRNTSLTNCDALVKLNLE